jgi:hypothetical protein
MAIDAANFASAARCSATAATIAASSSFETGAFQLLLRPPQALLTDELLNIFFVFFSVVVVAFAAVTTLVTALLTDELLNISVVVDFSAVTTLVTGGGRGVARDKVEQIRQHRFLCGDFIHCTDPYASRYFIRPHGPSQRFLMSAVGCVTTAEGAG